MSNQTDQNNNRTTVQHGETMRSLGLQIIGDSKTATPSGSPTPTWLTSP